MLVYTGGVHGGVTSTNRPMPSPLPSAQVGVQRRPMVGSHVASLVRYGPVRQKTNFYMREISHKVSLS
jgi:hypothetical protein